MADLGQELIWEAKVGNKEGVGTLLEKGAPLDARDASGDTALMSSASNGHLDVVRLLAAKGANIYTRNRNDKTVLQRAAQNNHLPVCLFLISLGADPSTEDRFGRSALTSYGEGMCPASLDRDVNRTALKGAREAYLKGLAISQHQPAKNVASLLFSETFADLVFVCPGGERIHAHRCIVAMCSPHMKALLQGPWAENAGGGQVSEVVMLQSAMAVRALLRYMYTGEVDAAAVETSMSDVLDLASQHEQPALKAACADLIGESISGDCIGLIIEIALLYELPLLRAKCIAFVETNNNGELSLPTLVEMSNKFSVPEIKTACSRGCVAILCAKNLLSFLEAALHNDMHTLKHACIAFAEKNISRFDLSGLLKFADEHNIPDLKPACERGAVAALSTYNVWSNLEIALRHDLPMLKYGCSCYIGKHVTHFSLSTLVEFANKHGIPELRAYSEHGAAAALKTANVMLYLENALRFDLSQLKRACVAFVEKNIAQLSLDNLVTFAKEHNFPELKAACERGCISILTAENTLIHLKTALRHDLPALEAGCIAFVRQYSFQVDWSRRGSHFNWQADEQLSLDELVNFANVHSVPELKAALTNANLVSFLEASLRLDLPALKQACIAFAVKCQNKDYNHDLSLPGVFHLANKYKIPELLAASERGAIESLSIHNLVKYLEAAHCHDMPLLKNACVAFVEKYMAQLSLTHFVQLANEYSIPELKAACERGAIAKLSTANAVSYLEVAIHHDLSFLQGACIKKVFFPSP